MKKIIYAAIIVTFLALLQGCNANDQTKTEYTNFEDLDFDGVKIGMLSDVAEDEVLLEKIPKASISYYTDVDGLNALASGKIDAMVLSGKTLDAAIYDDPNTFKKLEEPLLTHDVVFGISPETTIPDLKDKVDEFVDYMNESGKTKELISKWFIEADYTPEKYNKPEEPDYTINIGTCGIVRPCSFVEQNELMGLDIDLSNLLSEYLNAEITYDQASFEALLVGLKTGKYDIVAANLYYTEDRADSVIFSKPYNRDDLSVAVLKNAGESTDFMTGLKKSFSKTVVEQSRYKIILSGLGVTLLITFLGFLLANIFGILFCFMMMSKSAVLRTIADIYTKIMQGTPVVVVLMILFYVVFGSSNLSGIPIAILGFGLSNGANLALIFYSSIKSIDKGQREAALALGLSPFKTLMGVILPEAVLNMLPAYFSDLIGLMKGTAVVGYVAVVDLTKAGDLIRAATFEAVVPLIATAIIYFLLSTILLHIMKQILRRIDPKQKRRVIKGVRMS